jgi:tetratricopeptide (TPR) repeat protein
MPVLDLLRKALAVVGIALLASCQTSGNLDSLAAKSFKMYQDGRYAEAEPLMLQVLEQDAQTYGKNHINYATALNNLATLYDKLGHYEEAEPHHLEALKLREQLLGSNSEKVASSLSNLAIHYENQARFEEAEQYHLRIG